MGRIAVAALHLYPLKSARGISVAAASLTDRGFLHDRRFMLVDPHGMFLTQRTLPRMALIETALRDEKITLGDEKIARCDEKITLGDGARASVLRLTAGGASLSLPLRPTVGEPRRVQVWADFCTAISLGDEARRFLSDFLGVACELVYMPDDTDRPVDPGYARPLPAATRVSFADGFPFLLLSNASLAELARRGADVPMSRFRPNLVLDGCAPFAEDRWSTLRIRDARFHVVKPCARCAITTVDQETGVIGHAPGQDPLRTLAEFRKSGSAVVFGQNLVHEGRGVVAVGDEVFPSA